MGVAYMFYYASVVLVRARCDILESEFNSQWVSELIRQKDTKDTTVEVQSSAVNIREAGTTSSNIISTAQRGEKLKMIDKSGSWYKVETESGTTGWVHASLVK